ncbi:MAG: D-alanyl-D-alanine carboxypeptidase DacB [Candidatus Dichloromethanomonas elyunquensis]|nr:MAG: D-alanyl-D-alanine carboxypeptidase DacB [Candidatus Dichloromethanomonas elyunquensis]
MLKYRTRVIICVFLFVLISVNVSYAESSPALGGDQAVFSSSQETEDITVDTSGVSGEKWSLPSVSAHSAILMDAVTGDILYNRDGYKQRPPASTTKILTAIVALEMANLDEVSTISEKTDRVGESSIYLNRGNKIKLGELIEGALVKSGNDACAAIAEQTAGSIEEFAELMNEKAISLGAYRSNFVNPHGLPDKSHYSTAYDLAVIARYAMNNPVFSKIVGQKISTINFEQPQKSEIFKNTNKLLWNYPLADGVKTGTTNAAGKCLVASASKEGRRLICVVLNAPDRFGDAARLMEWGFSRTAIVSIGKKGDFVGYYPGYGEKIPAVLQRDITLCLEKSKMKDLITEQEYLGKISLPIKAGEILGNYRVMIGDAMIEKIPLESSGDYNGGPADISGTVKSIVNRFMDLLDKKG